MADSTNFEPALESLRGIAALAVAFTHGIMVFAPPQQTTGALSEITAFICGWLILLLPAGGAVILFFVLSGYVLGISLSKDGSVFRFVRRRAFRILPAMWASLLIAFFAIHIIGPADPIADTTDWFRSAYWPAPTLSDLLLNAITMKINVNPNIWTLRPELVGSMALPVFVFAHSRLSLIGRILMLIALCLAGAITGKISLQFLFCFYLGYMLPPLVADQVSRTPTLTFLAGITGATMIVLGSHFGVPYTTEMTVICAAGAAILIGSITCPSRPFRVLSSPPLRYLGRVSYSFYLLHLPVLFVVAVLVQHFGLNTSLMANVGTMIGSIVGSFLLAVLLRRFVEVPGIRVGQTLTFTKARGMDRTSSVCE